MKKYIKIFFAAAALQLFVTSCLKEEVFPDIPVLTFESITPNIDNVVVQVSFTDGDGDLGVLGDADTTLNMYLKLYRKIDDVWILFVPSTSGLDYSYRIPFLTPDGQNKALKGDIYLNLDHIVLYDNGTTLNPPDSIKFTVQISDRANNLSNIVETGAVAQPVP